MAGHGFSEKNSERPTVHLAASGAGENRRERRGDAARRGDDRLSDTLAQEMPYAEDGDWIFASLRMHGRQSLWPEALHARQPEDYPGYLHACGEQHEAESANPGGRNGLPSAARVFPLMTGGVQLNASFLCATSLQQLLVNR
jgi:hypothetical protein